MRVTMMPLGKKYRDRIGPEKLSVLEAKGFEWMSWPSFADRASGQFRNASSGTNIQYDDVRDTPSADALASVLQRLGWRARLHEA
jgi:hypothetical protein